jgi:hypothetical protein
MKANALKGNVRAAIWRKLIAMLDTIFSAATVMFFVLGALYVRFCNGLR